MKKCELCKLPARLYCESDQASLCARCDLRVHEANFLVARHSRTLLCKTCQSPTPWEASGARLGNTVTECEKCVQGRNEESDGVEEALDDGDDDVWADGYSDTGSGSECDETSGSDSEEEEERENQVVPWSDSPSPPPAAGLSSSDESSSLSFFCASRRLSAKRMRDFDTDRRFQISQNDLVGPSSARSTASAMSSKSQRITEASGTPLRKSFTVK